MSPARHDVLVVPAEGIRLPGVLTIPDRARGIVLFAHGSGSSRHSPRNQRVAAALHDAGIGTLLFDLLTPDEDRDYARRFDIALLTERLVEGTRLLAADARTGTLPFAYFGASTGAAAALGAAASCPGTAAVVSRGGRPDLTPPEALEAVQAPTLLIVGGADLQVLALNRAAERHLRCTKALAIVPGATHLFEEPGALEAVIRIAADWFGRWLDRAPRKTSGAPGPDRR